MKKRKKENPKSKIQNNSQNSTQLEMSQKGKTIKLDEEEIQVSSGNKKNMPTYSTQVMKLKQSAQIISSTYFVENSLIDIFFHFLFL